MHLVIDDTYGPAISTTSDYVTDNRRTNVAIAFPDEDVFFIQNQIVSCLKFVNKKFSIDLKEFHFVEIYNRKSPWDKLHDKANLAIFSFFAEIYTKYKWKVFIQTVDNRTLKDHNVEKVKGKR